jgi:chromosome segregation ATPase
LPSQKTFGEPQPENPTGIVTDNCEASKEQLDSLRQENNQLREKEQRVQAEYEQLQLSLAAAKKELQAHEDNLRVAIAKSNIQEEESRELEDKVKGLEQNNSGLVKDLESADHRIAALRKQVDRYHEIILKNTSESSIQTDDAAITSKFRSLREQIQRLVSRYYTMSKAPPKPHRTADVWSIELYKLWELGLDEHELRCRVRSLVFRCMDGYILSRSYFGLDGLDPNEIETGLESFENLLRQTAECIFSNPYL